MNDHPWLHLLATQTLLFSAAVLMMALVRPALRRAFDAGAVYLAWLLVPLVLLAPVLPRLVEGQVLPAPVAMLEELVPTWVAAPNDAAARPVTPSPATTAASETRLPALPALALGAWAFGVLAVLALLAWRQARFGARLQRSPEGWIAPAGDSPALLGIWHARLVLPQDFTQRFSPREQALILAHEAVHARRRDNAWNLLAVVLLVLQWFNPLAWWALQRMRQDQELACDAAVLNQQVANATPEEPLLKTYLNALLKSHPGRDLPVLSTGWAHRHPLLERVSLLARHAQPAWRRHLGRAGVLGLCLGATALSQAAGSLTPAAPAQPVKPAAPVRSAAPATAPAPAAPLATAAPTASPAAPATQAAVPASASPAPSASAPEAPKGQGLMIELASQQGSQSWEHRRMSVVLPLNGMLNSSRLTTMQSPQGEWCLGITFYGGPADTVRPMAEILDKSCQQTLTGLVELQIGHGPQTLATRLPGPLGVPLQAQVTVTLRDPYSASFQREIETPRPALTPEQKAEAERFAAEFRRLREETQAQDRAWRQARGEAP